MASFWMGLTKLLAYFFGLTLIQNIYQTLGAFPRLVKRTPRNFKNNTEILCSEPVIGIHDKLTYIQAMLAGALSRTIAQTVMHPANTYKTMLQMRRSGKMLDLSPERLFRGADAQFVMSLPHGAFYFSVIDLAKKQVSKFLPEKLGFLGMGQIQFCRRSALCRPKMCITLLGDFAASTFSTIICSTVSTPQMVITDRLMGGVYPSFPHALKTILTTEGIAGFYTGWWPALAQKIPSYG
jgi:solute carrier family 25 S-adenosylmethionine transporter 26